MLVDWSSGITACYFFWEKEIVAGALIAFLPSLIVSLIVVRFANLEKLKNSSFGRYYQRNYSKTVDLIRFVGFITMATGSWYHAVPFIATGFLVIISTWMYGLLPTKRKK